MVSGFEDGYCPFCDIYNKQIVLKETKGWQLIANIAPYWKYHTIIVPRRHIVDLPDITSNDHIEIIFLYGRGILTSDR